MIKTLIRKFTPKLRLPLLLLTLIAVVSSNLYFTRAKYVSTEEFGAQFFAVYSANHTWSYTGGEQTFTVPVSGYYAFQIRGGNGGKGEGNVGGNGGIAKGVVWLDANEVLNLRIASAGQGNVGAKDEWTKTGYWNGHATGNRGDGRGQGGAGGGASVILRGGTDVGSIYYSTGDLLAVAGGGGGGGEDEDWDNGSNDKSRGGDAGNINGEGAGNGLGGRNTSSPGDRHGAGGTGTGGGRGGTTDSGGSAGGYLHGGDAEQSSYAAGGGVGFYGGGGGSQSWSAGDGADGAGGGGSSWVKAGCTAIVDGSYYQLRMSAITPGYGEGGYGVILYIGPNLTFTVVP